MSEVTDEGKPDLIELWLSILQRTLFFPGEGYWSINLARVKKWELPSSARMSKCIYFLSVEPYPVLIVLGTSDSTCV